ncbi:MAG TPA: Gfo/Idh/MocA family oxidoreductase [Abditibacteriaceae bacterium]|nr:Gfo/Idh/MocA family oxidoreductase [Abditibacteriaceae bacterium]
MTLPIRVAVIGGGRGRSFMHGAQNLPDKLKLTTICDLREATLADWRSHADIHCTTDYEEVLNDPNIDAVCIATPVQMHARQAIAALEAGKHVLSEVTAAYTLDECWGLIEAVERSGLTYMMAENYCFTRDVMMVSEMVRQGVFGDIIFAEGSYLHDCRDLFFHPDGELTWRGELRRTGFFNGYPTHSLGPVCQWLDINRGDRLASTATWHSGSSAVGPYVQRNLGSEHPLVDNAQWRLPDTVSTLIRTEQQRLIEHRLDFASPRPHHMNRYALQGTRASFTSHVDPHQESLIWIEDRSPTSKSGVAQSWEPLFKYAAEFEHPLWRRSAEEAAKAGHGGGDYFILREFADAIIENRPPLIDVYDAVTWSSITPLSAISMEHNNAPVAVPDFKNRARREQEKTLHS